jgi:hypothetical protein
MTESPAAAGADGASSARGQDRSGAGILRALFSAWGGARFGLCAAWALLCFGMELFHFHWTIDEELIAFTSKPNLQWVAQGRWAMYVWNGLFFPDGVTPLVPQAVALACLVASAALLGAWLAPAGRAPSVLVACLFMAHPVHALMLTFSTAQYGLFLGLLLAVCGAILVAEGAGWRSLALATTLLTLALATYQPCVLAGLALLFGWAATRLLDASRDGRGVRRELLAAGRRVAFAFAGAVVAYKAIDLAANALARTPSQYLDSGLGGLLGAGGLEARIHWALRAIRVYYWEGVRLEDRFILAGYVALLAAAVVWLATRPVAPARRALAAAAVVALPAVPFSFELAFAAALPERSHVAIPVVVALVAALALSTASRAGRTVLLVGVAALCLRMATLDNKLALAQQLSAQADRDEVRRIQSEIERLEGYEALPRPIQLTFVGALQRPADVLYRQVDVVGGSFLSWDNGNPWRIDAYLRTVGITGFRPVDRATWTAMKERVRGGLVPAWPARGSVRLIDGIVVVKLGEP